MTGFNPLNLGTVANDRTGDDWRSGGTKLNDMLEEIYGGLVNNVVPINTLADFPEPVGGVIELTGGSTITYVIASKNIDIGSNVFTVTGGTCVIRGTNRFTSRISTIGTGDLFTVIDAGFATEFIALSCPNSDYIVNFVSSVFGTSCVFQNAIFVSCKSIARIDGAFTTSIRTCTSVTTTVGGFDWIGTGNNQINCTDFLGLGTPLGWSGTLLNLGTATFSLIVISGDNRFISPIGTTILSGAAASANINSGGRALVAGNIFNGTGTAISGIDTQDLQWTFLGNVFADGTTLNTRNLVDVFLTSTTTATIGVIGTYVAVGGVNWASDISDRFTTDTAGILTYIGLETIEVQINSNATVEKSGGGADKLCTRIAIDTGSGFVTQAKTVGCTENATPTQVSSAGIFSISTGDKLQLFVANESTTTNIIVSEANMIAGGM